jgi:surfactin synthase thioesterase subunit
VRLFCLPYAGAGASAFRQWPAAFGPRVEVSAVTLAGRESRYAEPAAVDIPALAEALAGCADRPFALYGHSMGARIGYEVAHALRALDGPQPVRLFVGGARPPDQRAAGLLDGIAGLPEPEFVQRLVSGGGIPAEVLAEPDLLEVVLPVIRADLSWIDGYRYQSRPPLAIPIVSFAGAQDPAIEPGELAGWTRHTTAGHRAYVLPGGHFFLHERLTEMVRLIEAELFAATAIHAPTGHGVVVTEAPPAHRVALGDGGWSVWRDALLRGTGFPASGLDRFHSPAAAAAADQMLDAGLDSTAEFEEAFGAAVAAGASAATELATDARFREAITWQNPGALTALDGLAHSDTRNNKRREREVLLLRYWQRYCGKNDTIGFFGPTCWATIDPASPVAVTARAGDGLTRGRRVDLEAWALAAYADRLAEDPAVRRFLPVSRPPQLWLTGRDVLRPALPPIHLSAAEATAFQAADGRRAVDVVGDLGARTDEDGYLLLAGLAARGLLVWGADLPISSQAETVLRHRLAGIAEPDLRHRASAGLDRLTQARDAVGDAAGDPDKLRAALAALDEVFTEVTGRDARRRAGQTYAGRQLCYEDTDRDLDLTFGAPLLRDLAAPLGILLQAARWLTVALEQAYAAALRALYDELAVDGRPVVLADLWYFAQGSLWGTGDRPVDAVAADFASRWADLFGLAGNSGEPITLTAAAIKDRVAAAFPARRPGWSAARVHSPDLQLCAAGLDALNRGEYFVVLGEMHTANATLNCAVFTDWHRDPAVLRDALAADVGPDRIWPLYPLDWPRHTGRLTRSLIGPTDRWLGFAAAPGAPGDRLLPATAVRVTDSGGTLVATGPDGQQWPLSEVFSELLAMHAGEGFKLVAAAAHTPRITVDRLVVSRETWRTTIDATGLATAKREAGRYLAVRRWRRELGLPERVYIKIGSEIKPFYADLTSPQLASALCNAMRGARGSASGDVPVVITEALPAPDQAWVPDGRGNRYFSELRLHITDGEVVDG